MRIFVSADLEGINGIVAPEDIETCGDGYQLARKLMTEEANAIIEGAFCGGATEVLICDSHNISQNIIYDMLDDRATLLRGDTRRDSMVHSIDSSYAGLILLGYHAKFGTENAILDHSFSPSMIRNITINGISYGELGINSLFAAAKNVPLIMATGDYALSKEAKGFYKDVETVVVKYAEGRFSARCLPRALTQKSLTETAEKAVKNASKKIPVSVPSKLHMEIEFQQVNLADGAMRVKGIKRVGPFTVGIDCSDMTELMATRQVIFNSAAGFYNPLF